METVEKYLTWAAEDRGFLPNTIARYKSVLDSVPHPDTIDREGLEAWWESRRDLSPRTRNNELAVLNAFYKWAIRYDYRTDNPARRIVPPVVREELPTPITSTELKQLLTFLEGEPDLLRAAALGAYAGLRIGEAATASWDLYTPHDRMLRIVGKGAKERHVAISAVLYDLIGPPCGGNIVTAGERPYAAGTLTKKINRRFRQAGLGLTFHSLRKRGAGLALSNGANPIAVARMFGWADLNTAQRYAAVEFDELHAVANLLV